ncbi:Sapep family Mn(2+)-dependent dipeptidase [Clostridioides sp. ES-S-0077-01]|uniref:Sapep family Mn(2+)-dependent dipeptidase n=1 Tax=Clostridioides sp. ES-S-0077-01 TaxID=2770782 RepID=UPI001D12E96F|nr:Sapep family Mn(2+)-dependent dipeptidase [Clostridioides sp. ES-S-0077-01]
MALFKEESKKYEEEFLKLLEEWISIPSFYDKKTASKDMPFGKGVYDALNWFENLGRKNNFKVKNIDNHAVQIEYGHGKEYVDIFGHCDVVNPGEGWDSEPFKLNIIGDKLVARGVSDNKGPMIVNFLALKMIRDLEIDLKRKVRLIVGGNEESGFKCIKHYYSKEPYGVCGFTPDAKFPVLNGEKGGAIIKLVSNIDDKSLYVSGGIEFNTIPDKVYINNIEKLGKDNICCDVNNKSISSDNGSYIVHGKGGHSSKPEKSNNPILGTIKLMSEIIDEEWAKDLYKLINEDNIDGKLFNLNIEGKCGILSMVPTIINIVDGKLEIVLSVRYPEVLTIEDIIKKFDLYMKRNNINKFRIIGENLKQANYIDRNSKLVKSLHDIYIRYSGDLKNDVRVTSAGSYASEMNNSVIFGCEFPDGSFGNVHSANEFASLDRFINAIAIYADAIIALCNKI